MAPDNPNGPQFEELDARQIATRNLTNALYHYLMLPPKTRDGHYSRHARRMARRGRAVFNPPAPGMEQAMQLQEEIEKQEVILQQKREELEASLAAVPDDFKGVLRLQMAFVLTKPVEDHIEHLRFHFSEIQKQIENAASQEA